MNETDGRISLVPLQVFARDLVLLLHRAGGQMSLANFDRAYLDRYGGRGLVCYMKRLLRVDSLQIYSCVVLPP